MHRNAMQLLYDSPCFTVRSVACFAKRSTDEGTARTRLKVLHLVYYRKYIGKGDPAAKGKEIRDKLPFSKPQEGGTQVLILHLTAIGPYSLVCYMPAVVVERLPLAASAKRSPSILR